jgi:fluoride exporter
MIRNVLLVGLGGGLGSIARYLWQQWWTDHYPRSFPWGTFSVNLVGCLIIGVIAGLSIRSAEISSNWKLFLMTGICGGFTTFSAYSLESITLLRENKTGIFVLYVGGSVLFGLLGTYLGFKLGRI